MTGNDRRTLSYIPYIPEPKQIYDDLMVAEGWPYSRHKEAYLLRDRSLVALTYLGAFRISEVLRLGREQFMEHPEYIGVQSVKLSKSRIQGKPRNVLYREARLPLSGERKQLTDLVLSYVNMVKGRLYRFGEVRAWQIFQALLPEHTCHWFRAYGESYLYGEWGNDLMAVSDYVKVDARTLQAYIRRRYVNKPVV